MNTEQEIINQIAMAEKALEECEEKVRQLVLEEAEARQARAGKSADLELKRAAEKASDRVKDCRAQHLQIMQSLRKLNAELSHYRERLRIACQEAKHQYMREHLPEAITGFQEAAVKLMALQGIVTENVTAADAFKYISDHDLHQRALNLQAEMLKEVDLPEGFK